MFTKHPNPFLNIINLFLEDRCALPKAVFPKKRDEVTLTMALTRAATSWKPNVMRSRHFLATRSRITTISLRNGLLRIVVKFMTLTLIQLTA